MSDARDRVDAEIRDLNEQNELLLLGEEHDQYVQALRVKDPKADSRTLSAALLQRKKQIGQMLTWFRELSQAKDTYDAACQALDLANTAEVQAKGALRDAQQQEQQETQPVAQQYGGREIQRLYAHAAHEPGRNRQQQGAHAKGEGRAQPRRQTAQRVLPKGKMHDDGIVEKPHQAAQHAHDQRKPVLRQLRILPDRKGKDRPEIEEEEERDPGPEGRQGREAEQGQSQRAAHLLEGEEHTRYRRAESRREPGHAAADEETGVLFLRAVPEPSDARPHTGPHLDARAFAAHGKTGAQGRQRGHELAPEHSPPAHGRQEPGRHEFHLRDAAAADERFMPQQEVGKRRQQGQPPKDVGPGPRGVRGVKLQPVRSIQAEAVVRLAEETDDASDDEARQQGLPAETPGPEALELLRFLEKEGQRMAMIHARFPSLK